jgi:hypothetical protein
MIRARSNAWFSSPHPSRNQQSNGGQRRPRVAALPLDELPSFVAAFGLWIAEPAVYPRGSSSGKAGA